ncbi:methionine--tRNA ligase [Sporosarcina oncorhynchi]|uniref:Methionine--tRNA ligase n=1 Tax=Sporosarcina oncorhynchi TaxID=3056444 RepID=A0ABZ0L773_9BACL|nr:methionine--tRNA ligase [Sporosarcina sp. T2O-4]WOV87778.1 methionine--tRNA ligase [Sporosarcina sp. T2O-4]
MAVFIGGAWPYANGSLHLGHIAALLPGDILARYYRLKGEKVLYVSGSDCNGTPISIRANAENVTVKEIADRFHIEFVVSFARLGFTYDIYTRTDGAFHHQIVRQVFLKLVDRGLVFKKETDQTYCEFDERFLPDRFVEGICPHCGSKARGDQCDHCGSLLDPSELINRKCKLCGNEPTTKKTEHFYFKLSDFQQQLSTFVAKAKAEDRWRDNAINQSERYLSEGLHDRAASRDLANGVNIPVLGYEGKKVYVWIEAVTGYYSASREWAALNRTDLDEYWNEEMVSYYVHGKDNIPFHTIIWPAILMGIDQENALPTHVISNEYLTLEKRKLSTSENWAVWVPDMLDRYRPDSLRYFLTANAPENRDADFSWREFIYSHNSELLGAYGNFVNRTLKFIEKSFASVVPQAEISMAMKDLITGLYPIVGEKIEKGHFKEAIDIIFEAIRKANKYFDDEKPWIQIKEEEAACAQTMATCVYLIANFAQLLSPFLPFSSEDVGKMLKIQTFEWQEVTVGSRVLSSVGPLFERIDVGRIEEELERLHSGKLG